MDYLGRRPPHDGPTQFERLPELKPKTAIFVGAKDEPERLRCAGRMKDHIPGAQLVEIPDSYTLMPLDQPALLAQTIRGFTQSSNLAV